mmetsp:Transcript_19133/g.41557  ORF Transcript_19133/g.41557 Transcript_19133/m.41557 type:complete len:392 (-) Transcript_19133:2276-3451(-)
MMIRRFSKPATRFCGFASPSSWIPRAPSRGNFLISAQTCGSDSRFSWSDNQFLRGFSTEKANDKKQSAKIPKATEELVDAVARGVGQVIFLNSPKSGQIIGLGLAVGDPYLAALAALGTVTATATATAAGLDKASINDGLMSYNGCLVGCASAVFGSPSIIAATTATIVGASATPFVAATLKEAMGSVPQWTFAFNFVTLTSLLRTRPLLPPTTTTKEGTEVAAEAANSIGSSGGSVFTDIVASPLAGISQIFVVQSTLSGAIILGGIGSYSPMLAAHALGGSAVGTLMGAISGAPLEELTMGLWGFNSCLTSMAVGVFFVHSTPTMLLSAGGAATTASLFGAMKSVFGAYGSPCLTLPFCFTMSACYLLQRQLPKLVLASSPHSPEKNKV